MRSFNKVSLVAAALMASSAMVQAADIIPPVEELPPEVHHVSAAGGWYIRGDIGYASMHVEGVTYFQGPLLTGRFEQHDLDESWSIQGGIPPPIAPGYQKPLLPILSSGEAFAFTAVLRTVWLHNVSLFL